MKRHSTKVWIKVKSVTKPNDLLLEAKVWLERSMSVLTGNLKSRPKLDKKINPLLEVTLWPEIEIKTKIETSVSKKKHSTNVGIKVESVKKLIDLLHEAKVWLEKFMSVLTDSVTLWINKVKDTITNKVAPWLAINQNITFVSKTKNNNSKAAKLTVASGCSQTKINEDKNVLKNQ